MARAVGRPITCPDCRQPFTAIVEQVIDVGRDPQAKVRLLSGRVNLVRCPHCAFEGAVQVPMLYHDPAKELLLVFVPPELGLPPGEQDKIIGDMQRRLMDSLPPEQRKGYLFTPKTALTVQSLVDQILEADGITAEVREAQRARLDLIGMLLETPGDQLPMEVEAHDAEIDHEFFHLLSLSAQAMLQQGQEDMGKRMVNLHDRLVELSTVGREVQENRDRRDKAIAWAQGELEELGDGLTRERLSDLALAAGEDDERVQALVALAWPAMDYAFFQALTDRVEGSAAEEQGKLHALRERLLELTSALERQNRAVLQQAAQTLREIMAEDDVDAALRKHLHLIDAPFMVVLSANIQAAEQNKDTLTAAKLKQIHERAAVLIQEQAPPEVRFVNALLAAEDDKTAQALIRERAGQLDEGVLELMDVLVQDLRAEGHSAQAERLSTLRAQVAAAVSPKAPA